MSRHIVTLIRVAVVFQLFVNTTACVVLQPKVRGWKRAIRCATLRVERLGFVVISAKLFDLAQTQRRESGGAGPSPVLPPRTIHKRREKKGGGARPARMGASDRKARKQAERALEQLLVTLSRLGLTPHGASSNGDKARPPPDNGTRNDSRRTRRR